MLRLSGVFLSFLIGTADGRNLRDRSSYRRAEELVRCGEGNSVSAPSQLNPTKSQGCCFAVVVFVKY